MRKLWTTLVAIIMVGSMYGARAYKESTDRYIRDRVVMLTGNKMQCSGIQILSPKFGYVYILTASHCSALLGKDNKITATDEQGNKKQVSLVKIDDNSDLMLLTPMDNKYIKIADKTYAHEAIRTITHGAGHATYTTYGQLLEDQKWMAPIFLIDNDHPASKCPKNPIHKIEQIEGFFGPMLVCMVEEHETVSDAWTVGGSSGGAVVDNHGHLVGIESMGNGEFSGFVRFIDIKAFMKDF